MERLGVLKYRALFLRLQREENSQEKERMSVSSGTQSPDVGVPTAVGRGQDGDFPADSLGDSIADASISTPTQLALRVTEELKSPGSDEEGDANSEEQFVDASSVKGGSEAGSPPSSPSLGGGGGVLVFCEGFGQPVRESIRDSMYEMWADQIVKASEDFYTTNGLGLINARWVAREVASFVEVVDKEGPGLEEMRRATYINAICGGLVYNLEKSGGGLPQLHRGASDAHRCSR